MHRGLSVLAISLAVYYVLSFSSEAIHNTIAPGLKANETSMLIVAGIYNIIFFILCGFLAAYLYKGEQRNIAAIFGLSLVVLNFLGFIIFPDEQPYVFRMLKVVIPLHAAMIGGFLKRKYIGLN